MRKELKVVQSKYEVLPTEVIAASIKEMSDGMKKLRSGKLNDRALVILIHKCSGVATDTVRRVIDGIENLEKEFLKPDKKDKP